jgi:hypothetical protein
MGADTGAAGGGMDHAGQTLAARIEWLIQHMWPKDAPPPKTNLEVAAAITAVTGEDLSSTGIWKLRTGRGANPTLRHPCPILLFWVVMIICIDNHAADSQARHKGLPVASRGDR